MAGSLFLMIIRLVSEIYTTHTTHFSPQPRVLLPGPLADGFQQLQLDLKRGSLP